MATDSNIEESFHSDLSPFPAYGPIDAVLGYVVFYVFVDRATPTVVDVLTTAIPDVPPWLIRLGLAIALWFVLAVTLLEQGRRQLAALGVGSHDEDGDAERTSPPPTVLRLGGYLFVVLFAGIIAAWTFEPAIRAGISLIRIVGTIDVAVVDLVEFGTMIVFFIAFAGATHALDRVIIGGIRRFLAD